MIEDKIYKEIEEWFMKLFNSAFQKQDDDNIYFYYNEDYIKKYKIAIAFDLDKPEYIFNKDDIIFKQNLKYETFLIKYYGYWSFLESKYSLKYDEIKEITIDILVKNTNLKQYTTLSWDSKKVIKLVKNTNLKQYTTIAYTNTNNRIYKYQQSHIQIPTIAYTNTKR